MARTPKQEAAITALADAKIRDDAVALLQVTRDTEVEAAKETYSTATKVANDKFTDAVALLEG